MNPGEILAPVAAIVSTNSSITAGFSLVLQPLRPYLIALAGSLIVFALWRHYRRRGASYRRRSRLSIILIWICAAILAAMMVVPQIVADLLADL